MLTCPVVVVSCKIIDRMTNTSANPKEISVLASEKFFWSALIIPKIPIMKNKL